jgi:hypothetical protein
MLALAHRAHFTEILERYWETPKKPHEGVAVWVSGFFGSGKSSFAKYLGLTLENRAILGEGVAHTLGQRTGDPKVQVLPEVFDRFHEAAARVSKNDLDSLMTTENLRGLTSVCTDLHLVRDQGGIETEEQLEAALTNLRDRCAELIGAGKKVWVQ